MAAVDTGVGVHGASAQLSEVVVLTGVGVQGASGQAVGVGIQGAPSGSRHSVGEGINVGGIEVGVLRGGQGMGLPVESWQAAKTF